MTLGEALNRLSQIHPHYFNSFYRRVRVVREAPRPMPAAATIDVTHRCALQCPFCIAADVLDQRDMPESTFAAICESLAGIGRITLIGGEPFQHPRMAKLADAAREAAAEVEVFTNGLVLGQDPKRAAQRLAGRLNGASADWLTLVLSVDPGHASQMSPERLRRAVDGLLEAERDGVCRARFSVTHPALATGVYLDTDTVFSAIAQVAPKLADLFMLRLDEGRVQETFYFNSVICALPPESGLRDDPTVSNSPGPEVMRLEDLAWSPEVAISFDPEGSPQVLTSLAAMWSRRPPPLTRVGPPERAGRSLLQRSFEEDPELTELALDSTTEPGESFHPALRAALGEATDPADRAALLRGALPFARIMAWDGGRSLATERMAAAAAMLRAGSGDRVLRYGGDEGEGTLETLCFRALLEQTTEHASDLADLATGTAAELASLFLGADAQWVAPLYAGARELLGKRVPLAPGEAHPLDRLHLPQEPGFTTRDELVLRPLLEVFPDQRRRLRFPGLRPGHDQSDGARTKALTRLLEMVVCIGGRRLGEAVLAQMPESLKEGVALPEERAPLAAREDDLLTAFAECTYDRNRQRPDEDNAPLLTLVMSTAEEHFPAATCRAFASRALTWLERAHRNHGLSATSVARLKKLNWRGADATRAARLTG